MAQALGKERATLEKIVKTMNHLSSGIDDAEELLGMAREENDADAVAEVDREIDDLEKHLADLEFRRMFSGEMDPNNAFLDIQAGSGGTEAQDWAEMLLRMYTRWGEAHGYAIELIEASPGEVAGIKSATSARFIVYCQYDARRNDTNGFQRQSGGKSGLGCRPDQ